MLSRWQFNILFFVGVGGAILLAFGPEVGIDISDNPTALTGLGLILTYVLTQKKSITHDSKKKEDEAPPPKPTGKEEDDGPK